MEEKRNAYAFCKQNKEEAKAIQARMTELFFSGLFNWNTIASELGLSKNAKNYARFYGRKIPVAHCVKAYWYLKEKKLIADE